MTDYKAMTYGDMGAIVKQFAAEVKRRNPLFANYYVSVLVSAAVALKDLDGMKKNSPESDEA